MKMAIAAGMYITYRRTGGVFALLTFAAVALAATVLSVAVAAAVLVAALAIGTVVLASRAVLPRWSWQTSVRPATPWRQDTIGTTAVNPAGKSDQVDLVRLDSDKG